MAKSQTYIIPFKGGIISPGHLNHVLQIAAGCRIEHVTFSLRQELIIHVPSVHVQVFEAGCKMQNITAHKLKNTAPNIVSSYVAAGFSTQETWLREGLYKDVFELFDYTPELKINICDYRQSFVPLFTGHLNWVASNDIHYWYLYIRVPQQKELYCWPELIYTNNISEVSKRVEKLIVRMQKKKEEITTASLENIFATIKKSGNYIFKENTQALELPPFQLTYYEGFTKDMNDYWLGIYRRDELFSVSFLQEICAICTNTTISQLYATPWKSIIIKNIQSQHRYLWDHVLGKYRINVRHAANELNWQVEDNTEDGLLLKRLIIRHFDKEDVRTYGLCFAVQTKPTSYMFGSVIIKKSATKNPDKLKSLERFDIFYTKDFNPNSSDLVMYRDLVAKDHIGTYLVSLCKAFYNRESETDIFSTKNETKNHDMQAPVLHAHQCPNCLSIYDETIGDVDAGIPEGTAFNDLPQTYTCPLCETLKSDFIEITTSEVFI
jgi:rubredoxin